MKKLTLSLLLLLCILSCHAQITGVWKGAVNFSGRTMNLVFHISDEKGTLIATFDSPELSVSGIPFTSVKFENDTLHMHSAPASLKFSGVLENNQLSGIVQQTEKIQQLVLEKADQKKSCNAASLCFQKAMIVFFSMHLK